MVGGWYTPIMAHDEKWLPIDGYEGIYEISSLGQVRRLLKRYCRKTIVLAEPASITPKRIGKGYRGVVLSKGGKKKMRYIHDLVARAFIGPPPSDAHEVAHGDGVRCKNDCENLSWKTRRENHEDKKRHGTLLYGERNPVHKLSNSDVVEVKRLLSLGVTHQEIADQFSVSRSLISQIYRGELRAIA